MKPASSQRVSFVMVRPIGSADPETQVRVRELSYCGSKREGCVKTVIIAARLITLKREDTRTADACFSATGSSREPNDFSLSIVGRRNVRGGDRGARGGTSGVCGCDREELPAPGYSLELVDASIFEADS